MTLGMTLSGSRGAGPRRKDSVERAPKANRFEFVVIASARARQLLKGAEPREEGRKVASIAQREVIRRKVVKIDEESA